MSTYEPDKLSKFFLTTVEQQPRRELLLPADVGVPIRWGPPTPWHGWLCWGQAAVHRTPSRGTRLTAPAAGLLHAAASSWCHLRTCWWDSCSDGAGSMRQAHTSHDLPVFLRPWPLSWMAVVDWLCCCTWCCCHSVLDLERYDVPDDLGPRPKLEAADEILLQVRGACIRGCKAPLV